MFTEQSHGKEEGLGMDYPNICFDNGRMFTLGPLLAKGSIKQNGLVMLGALIGGCLHLYYQ